MRSIASLLVLSSLAAPQVQISAADFPDFRDQPPADWKGPIFKLSQAYPQQLPAPEAYPWLKFDPKTQWKEYLTAVMQYAREGNEEVDWEVQKNMKRGWYHAPWLHWGRNGREYIHGLTNERASQPKELAPTQVSSFQNWAVGIYNAPAGYVIGQVWKNPSAPNPQVAKFPVGSVAFKLLFTQADEKEVPFIKGSKEWTASIYSSLVVPTNPELARRPQTVRLLQIDVGIRDDRVDSTTGWVFGTFCYNGDLPGTNPLDKMVPVGLMWGNDPKVTTSTPADKLMETIINPGPELPPQHLGWGGRLNGPVDNPLSSCLSCHATAQVPAFASVLPPRNAKQGSADWMVWFRNVKAGEPFSADTVSLDYSLQLAFGIQNYYAWAALVASQGGAHAPNPSTETQPLNVNSTKTLMNVQMDSQIEAQPEKKVYPVER